MVDDETAQWQPDDGRDREHAAEQTLMYVNASTALSKQHLYYDELHRRWKQRRSMRFASRSTPQAQALELLFIRSHIKSIPLRPVYSVMVHADRGIDAGGTRIYRGTATLEVKVAGARVSKERVAGDRRGILAGRSAPVVVKIV